jgi:hypothetical protein
MKSAVDAMSSCSELHDKRRKLRAHVFGANLQAAFPHSFFPPSERVDGAASFVVRDSFIKPGFHLSVTLTPLKSARNPPALIAKWPPTPSIETNRKSRRGQVFLAVALQGANV